MTYDLLRMHITPSRYQRTTNYIPTKKETGEPERAGQVGPLICRSVGGARDGWVIDDGVKQLFPAAAGVGMGGCSLLFSCVGLLGISCTATTITNFTYQCNTSDNDNNMMLLSCSRCVLSMFLLLMSMLTCLLPNPASARRSAPVK